MEYCFLQLVVDRNQHLGLPLPMTLFAVYIEADQANRCSWQPMRGTDWSRDDFWNWFKVGFHTYRHSFATNLAAAA